MLPVTAFQVQKDTSVAPGTVILNDQNFGFVVEMEKDKDKYILHLTGSNRGTLTDVGGRPILILSPAYGFRIRIKEPTQIARVKAAASLVYTDAGVAFKVSDGGQVHYFAADSGARLLATGVFEIPSWTGHAFNGDVEYQLFSTSN
ncbi:hypothetical protein [Stenotrophomonas sp.]|uniref:hypothetical protein n=1 Tax=Stenotrophomonas sp. TaxID=69392 RepID=UPI00289BB3BB|nr:hypothetical protein [Stenotrophomonas sp.]